MKIENIVFGPADLTRLLTATVVSPIYRIEAAITMDDVGAISFITAYPLDTDMKEITAEGRDFRIKGCPNPPNCNDIH